MDHNKLIKSVAKKALAPLGVKQQRNSRIWYDDQGWWAVVIEFQPSSWDRGSYLNVGLSWMLYEESGWSFNIGSREGQFCSAIASEEFESAMEGMAANAARLVLDYRERFSTLDRMCTYYSSVKDCGGWPDYYAGVLLGLRGDREAAEH